MKLIIAGGRDFTDMRLLKIELNKYVKGVRELELVCGMAKGADMLGYEVFKANGHTPKEFHADWQDMSEPCVRKVNRYGKEYNALAGMKRNHAMGDYATDLIAFWDGKSKGTKDMVDYMRKLGKPVHVVLYNLRKSAKKTNHLAMGQIRRTGKPLK